MINKGGKRQSAVGKSQAIVEGLHDSYYSMIESLDAPQVSTRRAYWVEGERMGFGLIDMPKNYQEPIIKSQHEVFIYVISGVMNAKVGSKSKIVKSGDVIHVPRGQSYKLDSKSSFVRYAMACSTPYLEAKIDCMSKKERDQARIHNKAN